LADLAIDVHDLRKTYRTPFARKKVEALRGVTFHVERGHIFGFVGPNGAGKTTTIRTLMGLIRPSGGSARLLGHPLGSRAARFQIGFLPESPYFYDYLTVGELCDLAGRLFGMPRAARRRRADELIDRVGLGGARGLPLKKFSKGMLQRAGLAQALMNDPELVVLDEPMSGLDPIGRKEVRDLILELRDQRKTVFFSTHILSDVEAITDRVAIIARGELQAHGTPAELVSQRLQGVDVVCRLPASALAGDGDAGLAGGASRVRRVGDELSLTLPADADVDAWIARAHAAGAHVVQVAPRHETLEDLFVRRVAPPGAGDAAARPGEAAP
jgi:ABC-2 type transport system ATP-binding protein